MLTSINEREAVLTDIIKCAETCKAEIFTIAAAAKLIDHYWQSKNADKAKAIFDNMKDMLSNGMGEILMNYSHGLGLYHHGAKYERLDYVKKVIQGLYFNAKSDVELTDEMKEFVNE